MLYSILVDKNKMKKIKETKKKDTKLLAFNYPKFN